MILSNGEKHFIISDEVAEPRGIMLSGFWVNHCGINYPLQTSFKNLCVLPVPSSLLLPTLDSFCSAVLGEQAAQCNLHKAPISKTPRGG